MIKFMRKISNNNWFYLFCIVFYSILLFFPLITQYINGDDTIFHIINIDIYSRISLFDKIFPMYANNFGWGIGIFYPGLPHIFAAIILKIIRIFGFGTIMAIKIEKLLITILSGITMYFLTFKVYKSKEKGLIGGVLYLSSSYYFVDIFMRDALNESIIFITTPLIFLGLYYLFNESNIKYFYICFVSGYTIAIYSHLLVTMWFTIILLFFLIFYIKKIFKKEIFKSLIISTLIVIALTGTFIVPLLEHMIIGKWFIPVYKLAWTLPIKGYIIPDYYKTSSGGLLFIYFSQITILLTIIGIFNLFFKKKYEYDKKFLCGILLFSIISVFLSSQLWFWKQIPRFLSSIQFAWRIVIFSTFGITLFACSSLETIYNFFKDKYRYVLTVFIIVISLIFHYQHVDKVNFTNEVIYNKNYTEEFTTKDYFPIKSKNNLNRIIKYDSNSIKFLNGTADYKIIKNKSPNMKFKISNINEKVEIELPRFYYLGYKIINREGNDIPYKESNIGLIKANISKDGIYELKYVNTKYYKIAKIIKICIILFLIYRFIKYKKRSK